ncbi:MAG: TetR/AcrR family transcriptional regulator [Gammaproteobacteria bacterium]|nr:TetR/AcrR family transcriptional regulator [Gammaproteobacteria bacterium]
MLELIEKQFASKARTPKGRRALQSIFRAMRAIVAERGLREASLDAVAAHAGLSQAALRHYFPTRDDLLHSFFVTTSQWFRAQVEAILAQEGLRPQDKLENCIAWHLEYMEHVETVFWLEASAYWLRRTPPRRIRDEFYRWLTGRYAALIGKIVPRLDTRERKRRAYLVLTMVLGSWITHGRGSALNPATDVIERRRLLVETIMEIATR